MPAKSRKRCINTTPMQGLTQWYKDAFEKLGWMVLAKSLGGMEDKVSSYVISLGLLEDKLRCRIKTTKDSDTREDLRIMITNVNLLRLHVEKDKL